MDHVQIFPVYHLLPQIVSLCPVGGGELVPFNVQKVGPLTVQFVGYHGTVEVPFPRTIVATI